MTLLRAYGLRDDSAITDSTGEPMTAARPDHSPPPAEWRDTFTEICDRHRGRLIRWLSAIFGSRDAEDIAQETLTRLFLRPGLIDDSGDAWPWLAVVARNVGRDLARHNALSTPVDASSLAYVADDVRVCEEVLARDDAARIARAMHGLTPRERAVIRMRDFEGATIPEIAELLDINENAVRQQLFRARRRLATVYVDLGGDSRWGTLVATIGLRLRELARRVVPFGELGGPSAAAMVAWVPGLAAAIALGLGIGGDPLGDATTPAALEERAAGLVERGVDRLSAVGVSLDLAGAARHRPGLPVWRSEAIVDKSYDVGVTHNRVVVTNLSPFDNEAGDVYRIRIGTDDVYYETWMRNTGGGEDSSLCELPLVTCS